MSRSYETLATDDDWMFDDRALASGVAIHQPATARLLDGIPPASRVLDAACGTGVGSHRRAHRTVDPDGKDRTDVWRTSGADRC